MPAVTLHSRPGQRVFSSSTFKGFPTDVAAVGAALLVLAGLVAKEGAFLGEALLTHVAGEGALARVSPVVFVQAGWSWILVENTEGQPNVAESKR